MQYRFRTKASSSLKRNNWQARAPALQFLKTLVYPTAQTSRDESARGKIFTTDFTDDTDLRI
jgi:hypothetical protein